MVVIKVIIIIIIITPKHDLLRHFLPQSHGVCVCVCVCVCVYVCVCLTWTKWGLVFYADNLLYVLMSFAMKSTHQK